MQSYEKILYNVEIFFLFSWLKNYKKDVFFRHLQLKEVLVTGAMGDMKMKETPMPWVACMPRFPRHRISNYIYLHRIDSIIDPETMMPRKQLIFYSFSKRLRNPVIINT